MKYNEILLIYDRECPLCDAYCRGVQVREAAGLLRLVNARDAGPAMDEVTARGLDIDQGMVLKIGDVLYYGPDAIHRLAVLSGRSGAFNWLNYCIFRSADRARLVYPAFRFFRNLLLKLLRKRRVNNLGLPGNPRF